MGVTVGGMYLRGRAEMGLFDSNCRPGFVIWHGQRGYLDVVWERALLDAKRAFLDVTW